MLCNSQQMDIKARSIFEWTSLEFDTSDTNNNNDNFTMRSIVIIAFVAAFLFAASEAAPNTKDQCAVSIPGQHIGRQNFNEPVPGTILGVPA